MLFVVALATLAATPNLAAPGLQCAGIEPALCDVYLEHFVGTLTSYGVKVTTKNDMAQVLGVERQKQLMGCATDSGSCLAELAGALGVAQLLSGSVAKTESGYVSTLKVIDSQTGEPKWTATTRVDTEKQLFAFFEERGSALAGELLPRSGPPTVVKWIPAMVGGLLALAGGVFLLVANDEAAALRDYVLNGTSLVEGMTTASDIRNSAETGRAAEALGWLGIGMGAAAIAASVLWTVLAPSSPVTAAVVPTPQGATLGLTLELP
ncbi:MAG: hypothetical protein JNM69_37490 [Archangium sp.]|nr:hypothetical protein [Archangium sp.]